jgi:hypothetical protein
MGIAGKVRRVRTDRWPGDYQQLVMDWDTGRRIRSDQFPKTITVQTVRVSRFSLAVRKVQLEAWGCYDWGTMESYAQYLRDCRDAGVPHSFPPLILKRNRRRDVLVDGYHRVAAALAAGVKTWDAIIL